MSTVQPRLVSEGWLYRSANSAISVVNDADGECAAAILALG